MKTRIIGKESLAILLTEPVLLAGDHYRVPISLSGTSVYRVPSEVSEGTLVLGNGGVGIDVDSSGGLLDFSDANTYLDVNESMNLTFTDAVTGEKKWRS